MSGLPHAEAIANRLSLRAPQREALEILARACDRISLTKDQDLDAALRAVQAERPDFKSFDDRLFPSLCFALATGVGKTRLMGAFIAWLHRAHGINDFLVLAPNLTIYRKLITDFTPNTSKYVFQGVSEFAASPPEVVTGDDFESGRGVRRDRLFESDVVVNIFNISKLNTEIRGDRQPRVKKLIETIGEAYFDYLAGLERLVLLMDESHRYRATAGVRAINELRPVLGLELTATPQVESGRSAQPFGNVAYSYPLANAIADGFVKEPAVATRQDFDRKSFDDERLERLKLEDGIRIHESTKVDLEIYARSHGTKRVKPFVLVVARDTDHAGALQRSIEAEDFFGGRYGGKVITVHSKQSGEERDEVVEQLLSVEDPDNPIEVVIHVNMLKEGWDVTNLFTIVPLRTADSKTLVEQSIGRGLRLPYGKRTGVDAVDRLTIVAHDRFREIVDYANDPDSLVRRMAVVYVDRDIAGSRPVIREVQPAVVTRWFGSGAGADGSTRSEPRPLFDSPRRQEIARCVFDVLPEFERLPSSRDLMKPEVQQQIVAAVRRRLPPAQADYTEVGHEVESVAREASQAYADASIDIPRVLLQPKSAVHGRYQLFEIDLRSAQWPPVARDILVRHLQSNRQYQLVSGDGVVPEKRPEDYVVRGLMSFDDVAYDENREVLYRLAEQAVRHLRGYLGSEEDVANVLQYHQRALAELVHAQMLAHYEEPGVEYETVVKAGFRTLRPSAHRLSEGEPVRAFREPVQERQRVPQMLFGGFEKSLYPEQRFQSDPERRFAQVLEDDASVLKWLKPEAGQIHITLRDGGSYLPDFVIETDHAKYLCEVKARDRLGDPEVVEKAEAGVRWCEGATAHARQYGNKPWTYVLVPDDRIGPQASFAGLVAAHMYLPRTRSAVPSKGASK